jgi:DNA polymerase-3 subunit beta
MVAATSAPETKRVAKPKPAAATDAEASAWVVAADALRSALALVRPATAMPYHGKAVTLIPEVGDPMGRLTLAADDGEQAIAATVALNRWVGTAAPLVVAADVLATLVGGADGPLSCRAGDKTLDVAGGGTTAKVRALPDAPPATPPAIAGPDRLEIPAAALARAIRRVEAAAYAYDDRPVLKGVHLSFGDEGMELVAADSFRLAVALVPGVTRPGWWPETDDLHVIPPATAVRTLAKLLAACGDGETVRLAANDRVVVVAAERWAWRSRLIDGRFPDWRQVFPRAFGTTAELGRAELLAAVGLAAGFAHTVRGKRDNSGPVIRLAVGGSPLGAVADDIVTVSAQDADKGQVQRRADATVQGPPLEVALDPSFLRDALSAYDADRVVLGLNSPNQAVAVREAGGEDATAIMPMVIGGGS